MDKNGLKCGPWLLSMLLIDLRNQLQCRRVPDKRVSLQSSIDQFFEIDDDSRINSSGLVDFFSGEQIVSALEKIETELQLTLLLVDFDNISQTDVAEITGVPVEIVNSRVVQGRMELKKTLSFMQQKS